MKQHAPPNLLKYTGTDGNDERVKEALCSVNRGATKPELHLIGKNDEAAQIIEHYEVDGLIDDGCRPGEEFMGLPVRCSDDVSRDSVVVNCSTSISPVLVERRLEGCGFSHLFSYAEWMNHDKRLNEPWFVKQQREDVEANKEQWMELYFALADSESRKVFEDVIGYRLSADISLMRNYEVRLEEQYFEEFLELNGEVFLDAGGFDGDTTEGFCNRDPNYKGVYFFEPSQINMAKAKSRLKGSKDIHFIQKGVSNCRETVRFDEGEGSASKINDDGAEEVKLVPIDEEISGEVSFLKMDLEGWEMRALAGAEKLITRCRPKMAIAVYHQASDFRDVYRYIKNIDPGYQVYLRHYTQGWSETVMFFVPQA